MSTIVEFRAHNSIWVSWALLCGFAFILYIELSYYVNYLVGERFENYLVSEVYTTVVEEDDDSGMKRLRTSGSKNYHNDILGAEDEVLNSGSISCCCGSASRVNRTFAAARRLLKQELSITSIIKA